MLHGARALHRQTPELPPIAAIERPNGKIAPLKTSTVVILAPGCADQHAVRQRVDHVLDSVITPEGPKSRRIEPGEVFVTAIVERTGRMGRGVDDDVGMPLRSRDALRRDRRRLDAEEVASVPEVE